MNDDHANPLAAVDFTIEVEDNSGNVQQLLKHFPSVHSLRVELSKEHTASYLYGTVFIRRTDTGNVSSQGCKSYWSAWLYLSVFVSDGVCCSTRIHAGASIINHA